MTANIFANEDRIDFLNKADFEFVKEYILRRTGELQKDVSELEDPAQLFENVRHARAFQEFVNVEVFGHPNITRILKDSLRISFGSEDVLNTIQDESFAKATKELSGQHLIGHNEYVVHEGKIFYRSLMGAWYQINPRDAFVLFPTLETKVEPYLEEQFEKMYKKPEDHLLFELWQNKQTVSGPVDHLIRIEAEDTSPEQYFARTTTQIEKILKSPVSFEKLNAAHQQDIHYLELVWKVCYQLARVTSHIRAKNKHTVYLLRDGMMMAEIQKITDVLKGERTVSDQVMINRKVLSIPDKPHHYYFMLVDALYEGMRMYPSNFESCYEAFSRLVLERERNDSGFEQLIERLSSYVADSITKSEREIMIVDTGFLGTINFLVKYILDHKLSGYPHSDVFLCVTEEWFTGIYKNKWWEQPSFVREIEFINRSDKLYTYKEGSLETGSVLVEMGKPDAQRLANIELIVMTTVCALMHERGML